MRYQIFNLISSGILIDLSNSDKVRENKRDHPAEHLTWTTGHGGQIAAELDLKSSGSSDSKRVRKVLQQHSLNLNAFLKSILRIHRSSDCFSWFMVWWVA